MRERGLRVAVRSRDHSAARYSTAAQPSVRAFSASLQAASIEHPRRPRTAACASDGGERELAVPEFGERALAAQARDAQARDGARDHDQVHVRRQPRRSRGRASAGSARRRSTWRSSSTITSGRPSSASAAVRASSAGLHVAPSWLPQPPERRGSPAPSQVRSTAVATEDHSRRDRRRRARERPTPRGARDRPATTRTATSCRSRPARRRAVSDASHPRSSASSTRGR